MNMPATKTSEYAFRLWGRSHHQTYLLTENRTRALIEEGVLVKWSWKVETFGWDTQLFPESGILITRLMLNIYPHPPSTFTWNCTHYVAGLSYWLQLLTTCWYCPSFHHSLPLIECNPLNTPLSKILGTNSLLKKHPWQRLLTFRFPSLHHLLLFIDSSALQTLALLEKFLYNVNDSGYGLKVISPQIIRMHHPLHQNHQPLNRLCTTCSSKSAPSSCTPCPTSARHTRWSPWWWRWWPCNNEIAVDSGMMIIEIRLIDFEYGDNFQSSIFPFLVPYLLGLIHIALMGSIYTTIAGATSLPKLHS